MLETSQQYIFKFLIFIFVFVLVSCSSARAPIVEGWHQAPANHSNYIVQKGDTLYSVSWAFDLDFKDLAQVNHLSPPYTLHVGQKLSMVPLLEPRILSISLRKIPIAQKFKSAIPLPQPSSVKKSVTHQRVPGKIVFNKVNHWLWPASGKVVRGFSLTSGGNRGIEIAGHRGEPIVASAPGKVVYAGSGLRGYGNLIIIKHNDTYLSAYAYNKILLVKEGMSVKAGQKIALMGNNNAGQVRVHFEIRRNGKPVNPMKFLL